MYKRQPFERAYQELLVLADMLRAEGLDVPILDLGGGLGVDYEEDKTPDFDATDRWLRVSLPAGCIS